jgi:hypothetical protein
MLQGSVFITNKTQAAHLLVKVCFIKMLKSVYL